MVGIGSQPFWLHWMQDRKPRRHAPDFLVRFSDGTALVLDSRPLDLIKERDAQAFAATDAACVRVGWPYGVGASG